MLILKKKKTILLIFSRKNIPHDSERNVKVTPPSNPIKTIFAAYFDGDVARVDVTVTS